MISEVRTVRVENITLAYRDNGLQNAPVMVLLHGLAETSEVFWDPLVEQMGSSYRIVAFDLLGHGDSDAPSRGYETRHQASLIKTAVESLGLPPATFVGHSLGGILAAQIAIDYPETVERLVLYDSPLPYGIINNLLSFARSFPLPGLLPLFLLILPGTGLVSLLLPFRPIVKLALVLWKVPYDRRKLTDEMLDQSVRHSRLGLIRSVRRTFLAHNLVKDLGRIEAPTLFVVGEHDHFLPVARARMFADMIPNVELCVIERAGHLSLVDQPEIFNKRLAMFLAENHPRLAFAEQKSRSRIGGKAHAH